MKWQQDGKPKALIAHTIKGRGVPGLENAELSHIMNPKPELRERLAKFALTLHPQKTRLIEFGRFATKARQRRGQGKPETFDFLGFTHICGEDVKGNGFQFMRKTKRGTIRSKLGEVKKELGRRMHAPISEQGAWLNSVLRGHYTYFAVPTNYRALSAFQTLIHE